MTSQSKNLSDAELVKTCQTELPNITSSYDEIVRRYKNYIFRIALKKLDNTEDAEDATQETFVRIFFGIQNFRMESELKTWITQIISNICLTMLLSQKRKAWKYYTSLNEEIDFENIYASLVTSEQESNFWQEIGRILRKMNPGYRKIFILKYLKNFSVEQLTQKIGATPAACKMKAKRAKEQFIMMFSEA